MDTERIDQQLSASAAVDAELCACGAQLPPAAATGRPALHCSPACRRRRDRLTRLLRRRREWIEGWRAHRALDVYSTEQIDQAIADLEADIDELTQAMRARPDAGIDDRLPPRQAAETSGSSPNAG